MLGKNSIMNLLITKSQSEGVQITVLALEEIAP